MQPWSRFTPSALPFARVAVISSMCGSAHSRSAARGTVIAHATGANEHAFVTDTVGNTRRTMDPSRSRLRRLLESVACEMPSALQRSGHAPPRYPRRFREAAMVTPLRVRHRFRWRVQPSEAAPVLQLLTCHRHNTDATSDAGLH